MPAAPLRKPSPRSRFTWEDHPTWLRERYHPSRQASGPEASARGRYGLRRTQHPLLMSARLHDVALALHTSSVLLQA